MRTTQAIINIDYFLNNLKTIRSFLRPETQMCIPVKADAYGHGAVQMAKAALESEYSVTHLAVATVGEAVELRQNGITAPIVLFSLPCPEEISDVVEYELQPFVFEKQVVHSLQQEAEKKKKQIKVHIAIDTGMGRIGCRPEQVNNIAEAIVSSTNLQIAGVCTHFAVSDSVKEKDREFTNLQLERFTNAVESLKNNGINPGLVHCANSGAILMHPMAEFDMVRPGIIIYGYYPDKGVKEFCEKVLKHPAPLYPVMQFQTHVCSIKTIQKGESISYGRTWTADCETDIATIPAGYADGLLRSFASQKDKPMYVTINGNQYPIVGRICMDQCMVNLGKNHNVNFWDKVVIFGHEAKKTVDDKKNFKFVSAEDIADSTNTISYEILCGINKRVPRVYIKDGVVLK